MQIKKEQKTINFGQTTLFAKIDKNILQNEQITSYLKCSQLSIDKKQYQKFKWDQILKHMKSFNGRQLWFFKCDSPTIIRQIQHIHFQNLIQLSLAHNRIDNIQKISLLSCRNLRGLYIHNNNINNIKSLAKWSCDQFCTLLLSNNFINQIQNLNKCVLQRIGQLSVQSGMNQSFACKDTSKIFKISAIKIQTLTIKIKSNIFQKNELIEMLRERYQIQKLRQ